MIPLSLVVMLRTQDNTQGDTQDNNFQEHLVLANFGTGPANAPVVLEYDNGSTLTNLYTISAQDQFILDVNAETIWVTLINGKGTVYSFPVKVGRTAYEFHDRYRSGGQPVCVSQWGWLPGLRGLDDGANDGR
jgi:hypothetical protein